MVQPLKNNVLIRPFALESAIKMVDDSTIEKAEVLAIGDEVTDVKVGDIIYFKDYNKDVIIEDNKEIVLIPEEDIKAICTNTITE